VRPARRRRRLAWWRRVPAGLRVAGCRVARRLRGAAGGVLATRRPRGALALTVALAWRPLTLPLPWGALTRFLPLGPLALTLSLALGALACSLALGPLTRSLTVRTLTRPVGALALDLRPGPRALTLTRSLIPLALPWTLAEPLRRRATLRPSTLPCRGGLRGGAWIGGDPLRPGLGRPPGHLARATGLARRLGGPGLGNRLACGHCGLARRLPCGVALLARRLRRGRPGRPVAACGATRAGGSRTRAAPVPLVGRSLCSLSLVSAWVRSPGVSFVRHGYRANISSSSTTRATCSGSDPESAPSVRSGLLGISYVESIPVKPGSWPARARA